MKAIAEKRLFWFFKEGVEFDLSDKNQLDFYAQQILTRGKSSDIRSLFNVVDLADFIESFNRIKNFLPCEVKKFWEEWLADTYRPSKNDT